jgi:hypothetical protein
MRERPQPEPAPEQDPLANQRDELREPGLIPPVLVLIEGDLIAIPRRRELGVIKESGEPGELLSHRPIEGLYQKASPVLEEFYPSVTDAIPAMPAKDNAGVVSQCHKLTPCPQGKVVAISLAGAFEILGRLPVLPLTELIHVADAFASGEELVDIVNGFALDGKRLVHIPAHGERGMKTPAAQVRAEDLSACGVVSFWDGFRDHSIEQALSQMREREAVQKETLEVIAT